MTVPAEASAHTAYCPAETVVKVPVMGAVLIWLKLSLPQQVTPGNPVAVKQVAKL